MARRKLVEEPDNHERWMVSYADFVTLLFAFFVVMYAISSLNESKYRVLSDSIVNAFRNVSVTPSGQTMVIVPAPLSPPSPATQVPSEEDRKKGELRQQQRDKMRNIAQDILRVMAPLIQQGKVRVLETSRGVTIEINDSILFSPGQAQLQQPSVKALRAIAEVLVDTEFPIIIEGHTDNVPISTPQFPSNWELSAVRATTVLRLFSDVGVTADRLTAIGYGETRPVEPNLLADGRARNRRVSILIESAIPETGTEVKLDGRTLAPSAAASSGGPADKP
ncbi:flagellar motor protein MotD [Rhodocyclus tenuis]|uniref:Chemotaxis protein MotB n=1 Tax=Rhodocyclus tenuis TaxID=1066 RepID=A0A840G446_RHOTE|nr:flagellar motor protein MotD [Rhodocyclus tenuis]MBB4246706.1 chemotaxis protein MotB [Rhodocyclus tenuis]